MLRSHAVFVGCLCLLLGEPLPAIAAEHPLPQAWEYAEAMQLVAAAGRGRPGVVLHIGDSMTYANPYSQWARHGAGKSRDHDDALQWTHLGADDDSDGWWLCRFDHPRGGRSYTAAGGLRADELLAGGKQGLPALRELLRTYRPQAVVLMIGTNDASAQRPVQKYRADVEQAVDLMLQQGVVCILSTLPPHVRQPDLARQYNVALRDVARRRKLPLIDLEAEILKRRPQDWNGTLLSKGDVHLTPGTEPHTTASEPTAEHLRNSGYLLRGWLSADKIAEVKRTVFDMVPERNVEELPEETPGTLPDVATTAGDKVRVPVTRDTWFSNVDEEADCNLGGAPKLKLKSIQEMSLVDVDPQPLRGRVIRAASLHLNNSGDEILHRVTVSSFASDWVEGTSTSYAVQTGSSTHRAQQHPDVPWAYPGSDLCAVMLGSGGTIWNMADASPPDGDGWQRIAVDPTVVAARVAGISHGFLLYDDTGTEWSRQGEKYTERHFPNRFVHSREAGASKAPFFTVVLGDRDASAPGIPEDVRTEGATDRLPAGEVVVSWVTPADEGSGTIGFLVEADGRAVPRYLIPAARSAGERVFMHLRDLPVEPGQQVRLKLRAVDGAGNISPPATASVTVSKTAPQPLTGTAPTASNTRGELPRLLNAQISILDALDKVQPVTGEMIPPQPADYRRANHLWNAQDRQIRLHAARNEWIDFQILVEGAIRDLDAELRFERPDEQKGAPPANRGPGGQRRRDDRSLRTRISQYWLVPTSKGLLPDAIVPLRTRWNVPSREQEIAGQTSGSLLAEVYVPHLAAAGQHRGVLTLKAGKEQLELPVRLTVWNFTLPDYLSFLPEMNSYGLPENEFDYYRVAHEHRTVLNSVPYSQNGTVHSGAAPALGRGGLDWTAWDRRFGQYFDGSAFADLPRGDVPLECFYLPLHENWPASMEGNFNGDYWADRAFPPEYRDAFVEVSRQMTAHFHERGWHQTLFHCYLNNKNNYKQRGWSWGSSPWLLDEPANWQDYWALRYFGEAFHQGVGRVPEARSRMLFRGDISRPQWQRDALDHVLDYNVIGGGPFREYERLVLDRKRANGQIVLDYGTTNAIHESNYQPVGWCLDSWSRSSDGIVPWQTVGTIESWTKGDALSLFYPGQPVQLRGPLASIRLKAYRRGQQDTEYLTLLSQVRDEPQWALGAEIRRLLKLSGRQVGTGFTGGEDAGSLRFKNLSPQALWSLRVQIGSELSAKHPKPQRKLVDFRTPIRMPQQPSEPAGNQ